MKNDRIILAANAARLAGTKCVDKDGRLLVMHHATNRPFDVFEKSGDLGFHFGARTQADKRRGIMISRLEADKDDPWRVVSCVLAIRNPLVIADDPGLWGPKWLTATLAGFLDKDDRDAIRMLAAAVHGAAKGGDADVAEKAVTDWHATLKTALMRRGHDGIVYRNVFESAGRAIEWSWVAFHDSQIVRLGDRPELDTVPGGTVEIGQPLSLRGVSPMRQNQARGMGDLIRKTDVRAFRDEVLRWAEDAGIEWKSNYALDYQPEYGEARPRFDLEASVSGEPGYRISVRSVSGVVSFEPIGGRSKAADLMEDFVSDWSEGFYDQGLPVESYRREIGERVYWRPAETAHAFGQRLAALHADFDSKFASRPLDAPLRTYA